MSNEESLVKVKDPPVFEVASFVCYRNSLLKHRCFEEQTY